MFKKIGDAHPIAIIDLDLDDQDTRLAMDKVVKNSKVNGKAGKTVVNQVSKDIDKK